MTLFLDHIFIITADSTAAAAKRLTEIGLAEGSSNVHPGQGTSNRRFFIGHFTLELLYISNVEEAANGTGSPLGLLERSRDAVASPFGIVARESDLESQPVFEHWQYFPDYFSNNMCFFVGANSVKLTEPLCICMPLKLPKRTAEHDNPGWLLSDVEIQVPAEEPSSVMGYFSQMAGLRVVCARKHRLVLRFNDGRFGMRQDFLPEMPLVIEW